jgi:hypothetical protein
MSRLEVEYNVFTVVTADGEPGSIDRPYDNGLVAATDPDGGTVAVIVTGLVDGEVQIAADLFPAEPAALDLTAWQDAAEVTLSWPGGPVRLLGADVVPMPEVVLADHALPGEYLLRVAGRNRDDGEARTPDMPQEEYVVQMWPAHRAAAGTLKQTSAVGAMWRQGPP